MALGTHGYQTVYTEPVSTVTATNSVNIGSRRFEGGTEYVYVYNAESTAAIGYGVVQVSTSTGYSVTVSTVVGNKCFGVVQNTDLNAESYGWVAVRGPVHLAMMVFVSNVSAATGYAVICGTDGPFTYAGCAHGTEGFDAGVTDSGGVTWAFAQVGNTLETIGTSQTGSAYINCNT